MRDFSRRGVIRLLGGAAAVWPLGRGEGLEQTMRRIGVLMPFARDDPEALLRVAAFEQGLRDLGWVDSRNVRLDYRWTTGNADRLRVEAAALVSTAPNLILANSTPVVAELRKLTTTLPTVFVQITDPVGSGFVPSLARPGGNITGFTNFEFSIGGKWLQTLKEVAPAVRRAAVLFNPQTAPFAEALLQPIEAAGQTFAVATMATPAADPAAINATVTAFARMAGGGLIVMPDVSTTRHREQIIALAAQHRLPAIYPYRYFAVSGGLISYGTDVADVFRRAAGYVDRIFKGEKPGDLPVQAPTKYETVVNLKTAKALGLDRSPMLLARADELIE
jgi:putative ABC transport system substrate-binding protein